VQRIAAEELHDLLAWETSSVNVEYDDEEGFVKAIAGELDHTVDGEWRTPDSSWLDLEEQDDFHIYHINIIVNKDEIHESGSSLSYDNEYGSRLKESGSDSLEGHWGSSIKKERGKNLSDTERSSGKIQIEEEDNNDDTGGHDECGRGEKDWEKEEKGLHSRKRKRIRPTCKNKEGERDEIKKAEEDYKKETCIFQQ
jgi:hypothetical protein